MDGSQAPAVIPALQRHLQMESDFFCFGCGYNLHGQIVSRDERLDFLVCRCPECGRFHPAAMGVSATRPWLARLGVMLAVQWSLAVIAVTLLGGFFLGVCMFAHLETYTRNGSTHVVGSGTTYREVREPYRGITENEYSAYYEYQREQSWKYFIGFSIGLSIFLGMFAPVVMWHASRQAQYGVLVFPVVVAGTVLLLWHINEYILYILPWTLTRLAAYTVLDIAFMAAGLAIGRPVVRWVLRLIVPPKLRQHVHFLWKCDGKVPPAAAV